MPAEPRWTEKLGATACWTAAVRARENEREDRLFHDPWAGSLAGGRGLAWIEEQAPDSVTPIALRTRFFDDYLRRAAFENGIRQIVLVAAGLDTRAFRLRWPEGTRLFELDQGPVMEYKDRILREAGAEPSCERRVISADLTADWEPALEKAGFDPNRPSAWLLEGLLFYLPGEALTRLLERAMSLAAPGSRLGFDIINALTLSSPFTRRWIDMQAAAGARWIGTMDDPKAFMAQRGWRATLTFPGAPEVSHGRWHLPVIPADMPGVPHLWYVAAAKAEG
jgi:methyltransferase (TIGR00027 family)